MDRAPAPAATVIEAQGRPGACRRRQRVGHYKKIWVRRCSAMFCFSGNQTSRRFDDRSDEKSPGLVRTVSGINRLHLRGNQLFE
jgi:hypothetical protein